MPATSSARTPKRESVRKLVCFTLWTLAMYGALQVHRFEGVFGHAICGPWGCGPPVAALVGYHAFWLLLIVPPTLVASYWIPAEKTVRLGKLLALVGLGILALLVVDDVVRFFRTARSAEYLFQRGLFRLVTFVDFPLGPIGLAGLAMRRLGLVRLTGQRIYLGGSRG